MFTEYVPFDRSTPVGFGAFFRRLTLKSTGMSLFVGGWYVCKENQTFVIQLGATIKRHIAAISYHERVGEAHLFCRRNRPKL